MMDSGRCPVCRANNRKREQKLIDMMFEIAISQIDDRMGPLAREGAAKYVADQLRIRGFDTIPMGMSWGVLQ